MKKGLRLGNKGLTLIELIIGIALTSVVMAAVGTFLVTNINFSNIAQDEIYVQEQVRKAMKSITNLVMDKELVNSISMDAGNSYTISATFSGKDESGNDEQLLITYNYADQELKYKLGTNPEKSLAKNISHFKIVEDAGNHKLIEVTIEGEKNPGKRNEVFFSLTNKLFLRN